MTFSSYRMRNKWTFNVTNQVLPASFSIKISIALSRANLAVSEIELLVQLADSLWHRLSFEDYRAFLQLDL